MYINESKITKCTQPTWAYMSHRILKNKKSGKAKKQNKRKVSQITSVLIIYNVHRTTKVAVLTKQFHFPFVIDFTYIFHSNQNIRLFH